MWEHKGYYSWSSPVCVYNSDGSGNVIYCESLGGKMHLLNGTTGEVRNTFEFGDTTIEASPVVYQNHLVVGTRDCRICVIDLQ